MIVNKINSKSRKYEMISHQDQAWRELMKNLLLSVWLLIFDRNSISLKFIPRKSTFRQKVLSLLSLTPSGKYITARVTCRVDYSTLRLDMDKPSWGPTNRETVRRNLPLIWPLTVFRVFKNTNFEKSWFRWPRQGFDEYSGFETHNRSGTVSRCAEMPGTWSGVL